MTTPARWHTRVGARRKGHILSRPTRYDKARTTRRTARRTRRGRDGKSVPLVIDGITHYSTAEAAERLGLAPQTVKNLIATGTLAHRPVNPRLNMVPEPALDDYARNHRHRRGRPKGSKNKSTAAMTADAPPTGGKERDQ